MKTIFLAPGQGRSYPMGRISAVFKADGEEDCIFYVIEGTMSILAGDRWIDAPRGSFVLAPAGVTHDFENRSSRRAGILNFSIPSGFEKDMPAIAKWYAENLPKDARP
jgi:mannose-6-phosphate isomerase-like protein (cupin superfamily)